MYLYNLRNIFKDNELMFLNILYKEYMKVKKMSYSNSDELKNHEVDYIQYLYLELHDKLQSSIAYIYELENQDLLSKTDNKINPLINNYLYNNNSDTVHDFIEFRALIRNNVFKYFNDIIKPILQEKHEIEKNKIYKKIIITDLYTFIPLIQQLINFYSEISEVLYRVCNEYIKKLNEINNFVPTNEMIINALIHFKFSIKILKELYYFIKTRKINNELIKELKEKINIPSTNLSKLKELMLSFNNGNVNKITIHIKYYIYYLQKYIKYVTTNIIKVDNAQNELQNFIRHIETSLTTYLKDAINDLDVTILTQLFNVISNSINSIPIKIIELLKKIIISIEIINSKLYNNSNNITRVNTYNNIIYGINIIILLKKFIEYLYTDKYIIIYDKVIITNQVSIHAFLAYINYKIYPNFKLIIEGEISLIDDIKSFLKTTQLKEISPRAQVELDKPEELISSVIFTDPSKPETIKRFLVDLKLYVLTFFQELLAETRVNINELKEILYGDKIKQRFDDILFIKNIKSLFKIIVHNILNKDKYKNTGSIIILLQNIIDLIINICIIVASNGNVNKYLLKGVINIILLTKLKDYFESDTTITYSYYNYSNIKINISFDDVMIFIFDNNLEYDLDFNIIQFIQFMDKKAIYDNITDIIVKINYKYDYTDTDIIVGGSGLNNKYKKTENKITVIYNKKKYTRVIYICEHKKYIKLNKTIMLLSKLKKVF